MKRTYVIPFVLCSVLSACGLGETATTAAAAGASKAEEIKQGQQTMEQVKQELDQINAQATQRLKDAETAEKP